MGSEGGEMTNETGTTEPQITTGEWVHGVLLVLILTAVVVGVGIWALVSFAFPCGCTTPA